MQWLNYHHLFYFRVIANEGGIAKAAERLHIGQPTLSAQLKQLEETVGKPLFERRNRKLVLTEAGVDALEYANEIFRLGDELLEVLKDRTPQNQIHLQIGALDGVPKSILSSLVIAAHNIAPCSVSILEGKGDELIRELRAHRLDLIVSNYPAQLIDDGKVHSRSVAKLPVSIYGAKKFKSLAKDFPQSLNGRPILLPTLHSKLFHDLNHYFKVNGIQPDTVAETQDTSLLKDLAENALGLAPFSEVKNLKESGLVRIGRLSGIYEELWLISAQRKIENPVAAKLMNSFTI